MHIIYTQKAPKTMENRLFLNGKPADFIRRATGCQKGTHPIFWGSKVQYINTLKFNLKKGYAPYCKMHVFGCGKFDTIIL